jgi:hypothetical protein
MIKTRKRIKKIIESYTVTNGTIFLYELMKHGSLGLLKIVIDPSLPGLEILEDETSE